MKDPKDIAYIFLAMAIGMGSGTGFYLPIVVFTIFISAVLLALHYTRYGSRFAISQLLKIETSSTFDAEKMQSYLKENFKKFSLINQSTIDIETGKNLNVYLVEPKREWDNKQSESFNAGVRSEIPGVTRVTFSTIRDHTSL